MSTTDVPVPGRYQLGEPLAHGRMGSVYRATDLLIGREVVVKVLHERYTADPGTGRRFDDEARITGQLQHPGIPPVHDLGTLPDGRPFIVMKLIRGRDLQGLLDERGDRAADRGQLLALFEQVCQTVAYAHVRGVVHRDLKPSNVMVGAFGEVQVMDWGLAKVSDDPEDSRADVLALGGILCAILTGRTPGAETAADVIARLDGCGAEAGLVALAKRCLSANPAERPADAAEVARAVATLRHEADQRCREAEASRREAAVRADELRRRRLLRFALVAAYGLLALSWGLFVWFLNARR